MQHEHNDNAHQHGIKAYAPLIAAVSAIALFVLIRQYWYGFNLNAAMYDVMAGFFLLFGSLKLLDLKGFVQAYAMYDVLAKRSIVYAYAYPFIEIALGLAYLLRLYPTITNSITLVLMLVGAIGVAQELSQKRDIACACLGTVFKLPMTHITLIEDLLMAAMAAWMLFV